MLAVETDPLEDLVNSKLAAALDGVDRKIFEGAEEQFAGGLVCHKKRMHEGGGTRYSCAKEPKQQ